MIYFYQYKITWHMFQYLFSGTKISMKTRALRFWKVLFNLNHPNWTLKNSKYYNPRSNILNLLIIYGTFIHYVNLFKYFLNRPIGLPVLRKVKVFNLNAQSSIQMLSISGNTIHFHCSFFKDKVIPPSGNTSFDVVFLGREEGTVENTLYIHTSAGSFRFQVKHNDIMKL